MTDHDPDAHDDLGNDFEEGDDVDKSTARLRRGPWLDAGRLLPRESRTRTTTLADRLCSIVAANPDGCSIMIASTVTGCGAYGRLTVDPQHSTEVRLFGWPRIIPDAGEAVQPAIDELRQHRFTLDDDGDWVWRTPSRPEMVPVAAHVAQRTISAAWEIPPHEATVEHIRLYELDAAEMMLVAAGLICRRCIANECGDSH